MIINENNKNTILKGMIKRGFNQDPSELRDKLHQNLKKPNIQNNTVKPAEQINRPASNNRSLRETFNELRRLKWKSQKYQ